MAGPWDPEELVGSLWHRMVGGAASYPSHPDAAVRFAEVSGRLGTMFRALGGDGAVQLVDTARRRSGHRLNFRQRIGLGEERLDGSIFDGSTLQLPGRIALFADRSANLRLYEWLAAYGASAPPAPPLPYDQLQADIVRLRTAVMAVDRALTAWPGLRPAYAALCVALCAIRPRRRLPAQEAAIEGVVTFLLGRPGDADAALLAAVRDVRMPLDRFRAPPGYRPFLPNPLWGEIVTAAPEPGYRKGSEEGEGGRSAGDEKRRKAARKKSDQAARDDPLLLNRFETIFGFSEMVNLSRKTEEDDLDNARRAADDLDEIAVGEHEKHVSAKLKMDLDLASSEPDFAPLRGQFTYPEWDCRRGRLVPDHCRVLVEPASTKGESWQPDEEARRRIRQVRRQFEGLRPRRQVLYGQPDGDDLDLSALVRSVVERRAGGPGSDRIYNVARAIERDLSVCMLTDVSLSTECWMEDHRVLDVEKEAMLALSHGLTACGDEHAILAFTSRRRSRVYVHTVKDFDEPLGPLVTARIGALRPGAYTRIGAAVRHARARLEDRPHRHRLLLLLTDGKPNDIDHYEGRYALEDTRMAVLEARQAGVKVFGITVDERGRDYFPYLFGPGSFAIFPRISRLPAALPAIYRHLTV